MVPKVSGDEPIALNEPWGELGLHASNGSTRTLVAGQDAVCGIEKSATSKNAAKNNEVAWMESIIGTAICGVFLCGAGAALNALFGWDNLTEVLGGLGGGCLLAAVVGLVVFTVVTIVRTVLRALGVGRRNGVQQQLAETAERYGDSSRATVVRVRLWRAIFQLWERDS